MRVERGVRRVHLRLGVTFPFSQGSHLTVIPNFHPIEKEHVYGPKLIFWYKDPASGEPLFVYRWDAFTLDKQGEGKVAEPYFYRGNSPKSEGIPLPLSEDREGSPDRDSLEVVLSHLKIKIGELFHLSENELARLERICALIRLTESLDPVPIRG